MTEWTVLSEAVVCPFCKQEVHPWKSYGYDNATDTWTVVLYNCPECDLHWFPSTAKTSKTVASNRRIRERAIYQGMNWIRQEKRLAIYMRDGMACVYCNRSVEEEGVKLTLDHVTAYSAGGSNEATNLVTACVSCNSQRKDRTVEEFLDSKPDGAMILEYVYSRSYVAIDVAAAKALIAQRRTVKE